MAGPRISERYKYMTVPQAAKRLGIHSAKLRRRLKDGIFPPPTYINEYGLRFFDEGWLREAQTILVNSFEGEAKYDR
jgi:predicted DNA-binding transcriptional regulator AlpA